MSTIAENWRLIFFAEGDDAVEYLDLLDDEDETAVVDQILDTKLEDLDSEEIPEPEDEDELYEHSDGYVLVYNRPAERVWLYELTDLDDDEV
jgi:hypothetical protein